LYGHIAGVHADTELDPGLRFLMSVARGDRTLDFHGGLYGLSDAGELRQDAVAERFDDAAGPSADDRIHNIIAQVLQAVQRGIFVTADELRKAYHVGYYGHRQPAADIFSRHRNP
jgi:hypothetical protein